MTPPRTCGRRNGGRGRESRRPKSRVFLAVDGETERNHFKRYARERSDVSLSIRVIGKVGPDQIIKKCRKIAKIEEFDKNNDVFAIVTDVDANTRDDITKLQQECVKSGFELYVSNPSFEVWSLSHYHKLTHHYEQQELIEAIEKEKKSAYCKPDGITPTPEQLEHALACWKEPNLSDPNCTETCLDNDPCTTIHILMRKYILKGE